jgi:hypothetical protein
VVPEIIVNAIEDARVNYLAVRAGVDYGAGVPSVIQHAALTMAGGDWRRIAVLLVSALDDADFTALFDLASRTSSIAAHLEHAAHLARTARHMLGTRLPRAAGAPWSYARTLYVARWLHDQLARDPERESVPGSAPRGAFDPRPSWWRAPWGHMTIQYPRLDRAALRRVACVPEGVHLRAPWRSTTDHAVFRGTKVPRHGSVLIDASGSMGLAPEDVAALARALPAGIVAAYGAEWPDSGVLRVLARRGVVASDLGAYACGPFNVIDGRALRWLATQPAPRVWVSDGIVTGIGDHMHFACERDADQIVSAAGIVRLPDVPAALAHFNRR